MPCAELEDAARDADLLICEATYPTEDYRSKADEFGHSTYADAAALLTGVPVCSDENYETYAQIVEEPFHDQTRTHEWVLPGVLQHFDMPLLRTRLNDLGLLATDPSR